MLLKDKIVVVSGIGPGLGVKLAIEAAREGAKGLVIAARTAAKLDDAEQRIRELGFTTKILKVPTDISDAAQCKNLADKAAADRRSGFATTRRCAQSAWRNTKAFATGRLRVPSATTWR